ncbi:geranylgeranylglycerol-phosphate geranylgeranyltransferase [Winogradskyella alexanderae]|uniref:Geranylgeranylglycerol-phosphate geranylgeranyltransferase n=1 Tax=Winogradskyella alexanderae TaxID=2877123 RepID=A0ABS7XPD3_9FLAO|nr:geranylgeranylglycerol-phosphate geranylgeranyltransferase [Winogradskyella alexanderae]MCA0131860.1 geranylgeranylglycerol-phosphate geranylgeranyltransferase [Winogradskyella alexanderae]
MTHFLQLVRWKNLLMIIGVQCLLKYALLIPFKNTYGVFTALNNFQFALLVLATICIAAAGYVINDINDTVTDKINKPDKLIINKTINEKTAYNLFIILNVIGIGLGFYLSNSIGKSGFFAIFVIASILLYLYSTALKQIALVGNIIVSLVVALCVMIVGIFELLPVMSEVNKTAQQTFLEIVRDYAIFAFIINLVRELVKDIEDIDGDYNAGIETLPVLVGRERANKVAFFVSLVPIFAIVYYLATYLYKQQLMVGYFLILVLGPLIYVSIKLFNAENKKQYRHISSILKLIMLTGMLSVVLYQFVLK